MFLLVSLTANWIRCITVDPGVIDRDDYLNADEIEAVKRDSKKAKEREFTIKKHLSIDPLRFKLPFEQVDQYERQYAGMSTKELRYELSQSIYNNIEKYSFCTKCKLVRPPRAHHCKIYGRYIQANIDALIEWIIGAHGLQQQSPEGITNSLYFSQAMPHLLCLLPVSFRLCPTTSLILTE